MRDCIGCLSPLTLLFRGCGVRRAFFFIYICIYRKKCILLRRILKERAKSMEVPMRTLQVTTVRAPRKRGSLERAIEDVREGRVYQADSVEDLMAQLEA